MVAGVIAAAFLVGATAFVGLLVGGVLGLVLGVVVGAPLGVVFGWAIGSAGSYDFRSPQGVLAYVVDLTWSLPNTLAGAVFLAGNLALGNHVDRTLTPGRRCVHLGKQTFPGYLTTIGPVIAGVNEHVHAHEHGHILQARIFGPLYLPAVVVNWVLFTVLPVWLLYHDHAKYPIKNVRAYFFDGVYPHNWNEAWCYRRYGPQR
jgi:hypothetical protein